MSRQFWREFLTLYVSMPCLWKVKSDEYSDREKRNECLNELAEMCRQIEPEANKDFVLKKINSYRTTFRKEFKKVLDSKKAGAGVGQIYKPTLWYYDILLVTVDRGLPKRSRCFVDEHANEENDTKYSEEGTVDSCDSGSQSLLDNAEGPTTPLSSDVSPILFSHLGTSASSAPSKRRRESKEEELFTLACKQVSRVERPEDEFDIFGKNVAAKLREINKVDNFQRILSEKLINDVIFHGQMRSLTSYSTVATVPSTNQTAMWKYNSKHSYEF